MKKQNKVTNAREDTETLVRTCVSTSLIQHQWWEISTNCKSKNNMGTKVRKFLQLTQHSTCTIKCHKSSTIRANIGGNNQTYICLSVFTFNVFTLLRFKLSHEIKNNVVYCMRHWFDGCSFLQSMLVFQSVSLRSQKILEWGSGH